MIGENGRMKVMGKGRGGRAIDNADDEGRWERKRKEKERAGEGERNF